MVRVIGKVRDKVMSRIWLGHGKGRVWVIIRRMIWAIR